MANTRRGVMSYFEVVFGLIKTRITQRPDAYFLTFRGYEILPIVRLITLGKPLVFDEFINPLELVVYEQRLVKNKLLIAVLRWGYLLWVKTTQAIVTDTNSHARYSAELLDLPLSNYTVLPLSTNEEIFDANKYRDLKPSEDKFQVFHYGSMLPLHGGDVMIEAMKLLKDRQDIEMVLVGGKAKARRAIEAGQQAGARIKYLEWIEFDKLPLAMRQANVCLGGPFGGTAQSQYVITGKTYQQMSLGCPVIIGKNHESAVFTDRHDALVVEQGSPEALAEAIVWAYDNRDKLAQIGQNGRQLYQQRFSIDRLTGKIESLFAQFLEDR